MKGLADLKEKKKNKGRARISLDKVALDTPGFRSAEKMDLSPTNDAISTPTRIKGS